MKGTARGFLAGSRPPGDDRDVDAVGVQVGREATDQRQACGPPRGVRVGVDPGPGHLVWLPAIHPLTQLIVGNLVPSSTSPTFTHATATLATATVGELVAAPGTEPGS